MLQGKWEQQIQQLHINILEMREVAKALLEFSLPPGPTVSSDNSSVVSYINREGERSVPLEGERNHIPAGHQSAYFSAGGSLLTCYPTETRVVAQPGDHEARDPQCGSLRYQVEHQAPNLCISSSRFPSAGGRCPLSIIAEPVGVHLPATTAPHPDPDKTALIEHPASLRGPILAIPA